MSEKQVDLTPRPMAIAIDFDGVVNSYRSGFAKTTIPDPPMKGAFRFIQELQDAGYRVVIHTARNSNEIGVQSMIRDWFLEHGMLLQSVRKLTITSKKPIAGLYIDDRGLRFTGSFPSLDEVVALIERPGEAVDLPALTEPRESVEE